MRDKHNYSMDFSNAPMPFSTINPFLPRYGYSHSEIGFSHFTSGGKGKYSDTISRQFSMWLVWNLWQRVPDAEVTTCSHKPERDALGIVSLLLGKRVQCGNCSMMQITLIIRDPDNVTKSPDSYRSVKNTYMLSGTMTNMICLKLRTLHCIMEMRKQKIFLLTFPLEIYTRYVSLILAAL